MVDPILQKILETGQEVDLGGAYPAFGTDFAYDQASLKDKHILLLFGGKSTEHMVSCRSAAFVGSVIEKMGLKLSLVGITKKGEFLPYPQAAATIESATWEEQASAYHQTRQSKLAALAKECNPSPKAFLRSLTKDFSCPDVVFPVLHGINCEDGAMQGFLQLADVPFVGANLLGSALGMDKHMTKLLLKSAGIPVVPWLTLERKEWQQAKLETQALIAEQLGFPCFVKPANGGSSVGAKKVHAKGDLEAALKEAFNLDHRVLVEAYKQVRELECGVLGNGMTRLASPVGEIVVKTSAEEFYDYHTKYFSATASEACIPAKISQELALKIQKYSRLACAALQVAGLARVDFFYAESEQQLYLNEINTLPGFTSISLYPQVFQACGLEAPDLIGRLLSLALANYQSVARAETISDN